MKYYWITALAALLLSISQTIHAEISATDLPSLGNLAKLIGEADHTIVEESVYDDNGKISSGMLANDSARGSVAKEIANILGDGDASQTTRLAVGIETLSEEFEQALENANFAHYDQGVAMAVSFISFWEVASTRTLSEAAAFRLGKFLVHSFSTPETTKAYSKLSSTEQAMLYDWLMTTPVAFSALVKLFESQGSDAQAQQLRQKSAELFKGVFKIPHTFFTISEAGELSIDADQVQSYQQENNLLKSSNANQESRSSEPQSAKQNSAPSDELSSDW